jgi:hypothetical protein
MPVRSVLYILRGGMRFRYFLGLENIDDLVKHQGKCRGWGYICDLTKGRISPFRVNTSYAGRSKR